MDGRPPSAASESPSASRRTVKVVLQLGLTGLVTWFILRAVGVSFQELNGLELSRLKVRWGMALFSSVLLLVGYLYSAALWGLMVREMGSSRPGLVASWRVFFTANLGRYLPGKLWQIAGMTYLARKEGVPATTATGAAVLGQAFSLAGATLVGAGVLLRGRDAGGWGGAGAVLVLLVLLVGGSIPGVLNGILKLWFRLSRESVPGDFRPDATFGVRWMGLYALGWLLQGTAFLALARGMGLGLTVFDGVPSYPAAYVLGYVAIFAPAGIGIREGFLIAFLNPILGAGGAILAVVARIWATAVELLLAIVLAAGYVTRRPTGGNERV